MGASKKEQKFLDGNQYSRNGITRYEEIFGKTFVSVGGETTTREFVTMIGLAPDMKVLDIGSGAGGSAFYMARNYKVNVHGIDLSTNMNSISLDYRKEMEPDVKHRCNFYIEDADKMEFPENFFDVVYSRDDHALQRRREKKSLQKYSENFEAWGKASSERLLQRREAQPQGVPRLR